MGSIKAIGVLLVVGAVFALLAAFGSFYTIDAGERGIVLTNGAISGNVDPGLHFKNPLFDDVVEVSTRTLTMTFPDEPFYSKDSQAATATLSVTFHAIGPAADKIYTRYGTIEEMAKRIIQPRIRKEFKEVMGKYTAGDIIQKRDEMGAAVATAIAIESDVMVIESTQVENIDFSKSYEDAVEQQMLATVGIATAEQTRLAAVKKNEQIVAASVATAESVRTAKQAEADGIKAVGDAQASAIRAKGEAEAVVLEAKAKQLADNPLLVDQTKAERWGGVLPTHMIPNGTVPFLDAAK
jgi:regulator of protease activity HflC (stomatin/prohibitin superfamily)